MIFIYNILIISGINPCASLSCLPGEECNIDSFGIARCECPPPCQPIVRPVCGTNNETFDNQCELWRAVCLKQKDIIIKHQGICGKFFCYIVFN